MRTFAALLIAVGTLASWAHEADGGVRPTVGGKVSPDGKTPLTCDLPSSEKKKNVGGSDGAGLCVFTSIEYAARYQNVRPLFGLQQHMRRHKGGGWPEKVDSVLKEFAPGVQYVQHTGGDSAFLRAALASGRLACVTYDGHDPHYGNQSIAHMVTLPCFDANWACVGDNNFVGDDQYVWMSPDEFVRRWKGNGGGWCVVLLAPPPPPVPHN